MADSIDVLATLKLVYTIYAFAAISIVAWFGYGLTQPVKGDGKAKPIFFWTYVVVLIAIGSGLHILTYNKVPWVPIDMKRADIKADKTYDITYENHKISFSEFPMKVKSGETIVFNAVSKDLTYGFGIFRTDHTLVAQMQVVPHNRNDLMWRFHKNGTYYIRSTEYSGPKGANMIVENALIVTGAEVNDVQTESGGES